MGNMSSLGDCWRRRKRSNTVTTLPKELPPNPFVFAPATPCDHSWTIGGRLPMMPVPYVQHQKANTIRNDVNLKVKTLRLEPDMDSPGQVLVSFTFDAAVSGRITVVFFAKESDECKLIATKEDTLPPVTIDFEKGLGQKFIQPSGTGIDLSLFEDSELLFNEVEKDLYPLAIKGEADSGSVEITQAEYVKEEREFKVRVLKQILFVNGLRYELNDIDEDVSDLRKECVVCLSEPSDTVVLPCRHMCMCSGCAKVIRFQTNLCPVCKQPAERLLEIEVSGNINKGNEQKLS